MTDAEEVQIKITEIMDKYMVDGRMTFTNTDAIAVLSVGVIMSRHCGISDKEMITSIIGTAK